MAGVHCVCTQTQRSNEAAQCNDNPVAIELSADVVTQLYFVSSCTQGIFARYEFTWLA